MRKIAAEGAACVIPADIESGHSPELYFVLKAFQPRPVNEDKMEGRGEQNLSALTPFGVAIGVYL
jgi:hypothetical protein